MSVYHLPSFFITFTVNNLILVPTCYLYSYHLPFITLSPPLPSSSLHHPLFYRHRHHLLHPNTHPSYAYHYNFFHSLSSLLLITLYHHRHHYPHPGIFYYYNSSLLLLPILTIIFYHIHHHLSPLSPSIPLTHYLSSQGLSSLPNTSLYSPTSLHLSSSFMFFCPTASISILLSLSFLTSTHLSTQCSPSTSFLSPNLHSLPSQPSPPLFNCFSTPFIHHSIDAASSFNLISVFHPPLQPPSEPSSLCQPLPVTPASITQRHGISIQAPFQAPHSHSLPPKPHPLTCQPP